VRDYSILPMETYEPHHLISPFPSASADSQRV